mmetsp:Transcript_84227/g.243176  ORF Transcript_84227/g.243176 Transcript_84227/m.243176 type:complete len:171 (-) Transcript_84227:7-519(-)
MKTSRSLRHAPTFGARSPWCAVLAAWLLCAVALGADGGRAGGEPPASAALAAAAPLLLGRVGERRQELREEIAQANHREDDSQSAFAAHRETMRSWPKGWERNPQLKNTSDTWRAARDADRNEFHRALAAAHKGLRDADDAEAGLHSLVDGTQPSKRQLRAALAVVGAGP